VDISVCCSERDTVMVLFSVTQCRLLWGHMPENTIVIFTSVRTLFNLVTELFDATIKCF
jgi:hypothetical protein